MTFRLDAYVNLTEAERSLLTKYKGADQTLLTTVQLPGREPTPVTVATLTATWQTFHCRDVLALMQAEAEIREACANFKTLLDVMSSFGGEEVIEIASLGEA